MARVPSWRVAGQVAALVLAAVTGPACAGGQLRGADGAFGGQHNLTAIVNSGLVEERARLNAHVTSLSAQLREQRGSSLPPGTS